MGRSLIKFYCIVLEELDVRKLQHILKNYGFENVSQLHGGIIDYVRQINENNSIENKFVGKNFVFDERRAERISNDIISNCHQCGDPCDQHTNCKNVNCNFFFYNVKSVKKNMIVVVL